MTNEYNSSAPPPLRGILVFPSMVLHLDVGREKSIACFRKSYDG